MGLLNSSKICHKKFLKHKKKYYMRERCTVMLTPGTMLLKIAQKCNVPEDKVILCHHLNPC